jgi:hypothetical protein
MKLNTGLGNAIYNTTNLDLGIDKIFTINFGEPQTKIQDMYGKAAVTIQYDILKNGGNLEAANQNFLLHVDIQKYENLIKELETNGTAYEKDFFIPLYRQIIEAIKAGDTNEIKRIYDKIYFQDGEQLRVEQNGSFEAYNIKKDIETKQQKKYLLIGGIVLITAVTGGLIYTYA